MSIRRAFGEFFHHLLDNGIYFPPSQFEAAFMSAAHTPADIAASVAAFECNLPRRLPEHAEAASCSGYRRGETHRPRASRLNFPARVSMWRFTTAIHAKKPRRLQQNAAARRFSRPISQRCRISGACFRRFARQFGLLDCLVNNAARFTRFNPLDITEDDWDFIHDVNLKATFFCCQEGARQMKERGGGRIVNISSLGGMRPWAEHAHYCASKAGVIMMTRALAKALAPQITVNSVAPGVIPFGNDIDARVQKMIDATPMRRPGHPEEIAEAVHFFLTAPDFITGQILAVDGGLADR